MLDRSKLWTLSNIISDAVPRNTSAEDMLVACGFIIATTISGLQVSAYEKNAQLEHLIGVLRQNVR